jgi:hypothetical protein
VHLRLVLALTAVALCLVTATFWWFIDAGSPARDTPARPVAIVCPDGGKLVSPFCRWYSVKSPFNTPISTHATVDRNSRSMILRMMQSLGAFVIAVKRWSVPVYYAGTATRRYDVRMIESGLTAYAVPIPVDARPSAPFPPHDTDGAMAVVDPGTGCEYDFWRARRLGRSWTAGALARLAVNSSGIIKRGASARGSGVALGAGLIRPEELAAGVIRHALVFTLPAPYVKGGGPVPPATESDGDSSLAGALPEGARVQLDPSFDVSSLPHRWERTIARALQRYGMYLSDRGGGGVGLIAQNPQSYANNPYPWGTGSYAYLPSKLISRMRVLTLPAQFTPTIKILPSRCGRVG